MNDSQSSTDEQQARREEQQAKYSSLVNEQSRGSGDAGSRSSVRMKAARLIHSNLLDYKHDSPSNLKRCIDLLKRCSDNIRQHPEEPKYRKVRSATAAFQNHIAPYPAAIELLSLMGFHTVVENMEKFWVFEHAAASPQIRVLEECSLELHRAMSEVEHKEHLMLDKSDKKQIEQQQREAIVRQIEEDFRDRQQAQALKRQAGAAESTPS